ncbi:hypothetical protein [Cellulosimicrobium sp. 72-3]|uniref:hypothetical protein n=1 Tax=Cellulosimicrobium sp. 72-3 TaxID=2731680 RepID=UPI00148EB634|nr:hypothetical protein [Cellulosimicrobium sp. 72-3]
MIQWGTVGEWVGGVGAIIGAGVPLMLYLIERRERIAAQAEAKALRAHEAERARKEQAQRVSVSFKWESDGGSGLMARHFVHHYAVLSNVSDLPVQKAALVSTLKSGGEAVERVTANWGVSGSGEHDAILLWHNTRNWPYRLVFVDDAGVWWVRHSGGALEETTPSTLDGIPAFTLDDIDD